MLLILNLPDPHQKGRPVPSPQLLLSEHSYPTWSTSSCPGSHHTSLKPTLPTASPPQTPHRLAGAHRRGPAGSQRPAGSRQTVFSKNCQRVVECSQAHPLGTCSHGRATFTHWPMCAQVNTEHTPREASTCSCTHACARTHRQT